MKVDTIAIVSTFIALEFNVIAFESTFIAIELSSNAVESTFIAIIPTEKGTRHFCGL